MSRTLKTDIPGPDHRVGLEEIHERGFQDIFAGRVPEAGPLVVEIGFGRGEFLRGLAEAEPEQPFVGIELSYKRVLKMARRLAVSPIRNVVLVEGHAEEILREGFADGSVAGFWLNFPDPWPKKRHARRRFVQAESLAWITRRLRPGGWFRAATDDPTYAEWIDEHLRATQGLRNAYAPDPWRPAVEGRQPTAYELEWRALGRSFHFFEYVRTEPSEVSSGADTAEAPAS
ncbi:MAG: tRNA (guanosine(46)-N7)-methyltransferase TrmB [Myxococcota bacterium]